MSRLSRLTRAQHHLERCKRRHRKALARYVDSIARWQRRHPT